MKLVSVGEMRAIENLVFDGGVTPKDLMQRAGLAVAWHIQSLTPTGQILILVGPGNNGGDGLCAASVLESVGRDVVIYTVNREKDRNAADKSTQSAADDPDLSWLTSELQKSAVVVDALLGIGRSRPLDDEFSRVVECSNHTAGPRFRVAVDLPTGVDADTGAVSGSAFEANATVTLGFCKRGNVVEPGSSYAGETVVCDLGMSPALASDVRVEKLEPEEARALLPSRDREANKGSSGKLLVVAGSQNFLGAPALCASAAYRTGAGLVEVALIPQVQPSVAAHVPEAIFILLPEDQGTIVPDAADVLKPRLENVSAAAFGPGLGSSQGATGFLERVLGLLRDNDLRGIVFDADALNIMSRLPRWWEGLNNVVVTPHPGEMSRLTGTSIKEVQADRVSFAQHYAGEWGVTVVLKGAGTVVASPDGNVAINPTGGPNLATAGTGDVLTGVISGFISQGLSPFDAAKLGAYVHGLAGDLLRTKHGEIGTVAGDLPPVIPCAMRQMRSRRVAQ